MAPSASAGIHVACMVLRGALTSLILLCGCNPSGGEVLTSAGELIREHPYVESATEFRIVNQDGFTQNIAVSMLFGPAHRTRIEWDRKIIFNDGQSLGRFPDDDGQLWTREIGNGFAGPVMVVGMAFKHDDALALAVARERGGSWWKALYGNQAVAVLRGTDHIVGRACYHVEISGTERDGAFHWWVDKETGCLRRFENQSRRKEPLKAEIKDAVFNSIQFPRYIPDEQFRQTLR